MDERISRVAATANLAAYDAEATRQYIDGAPHVKHAALRLLYGRLVVEVFDSARTMSETPRVLDLGAGEGSVTLPFLELGAQVVAVDISSSQLQALRTRCAAHADRLETRCEDIQLTLDGKGREFDIVVVNSFLHHVPDYLGMIRQACARLKPGGQFFSFQDPLRYDTIGRWPSLFIKLAYLSWRILKGDLVGGLKRRWRRSRGVYLEDSMHDNAEYHVTRNGVDQEAIRRLLLEQGFQCRIVPYFSTQSRFFQPLGTALGVKNTFAVIARRS